MGSGLGGWVFLMSEVPLHPSTQLRRGRGMHRHSKGLSSRDLNLWPKRLYRGTSLIRKRRPPQDPLEPLREGLRFSTDAAKADTSTLGGI